jgi:hypothetical protein
MLDRMSPVHDLEDIAPMLKQYGEVTILWRKGYTASFKWFGQAANHMEDLRGRKQRIDEILNPTVIQLG